MNIVSILGFVVVVCLCVLSLARTGAVGTEAAVGSSGSVVLRDTRNVAGASSSASDRDWERAARYAFSVYPLAAMEPVGEVQKLRLDLASGSVRFVNSGSAVAVYLDLAPAKLSAAAKAAAALGAVYDAGTLPQGRADCPIAMPGAVSLCALAAAEVDAQLSSQTDLVRMKTGYGAPPSQSNLPALLTRWGADKAGLMAQLGWTAAGGSIPYLSSGLKNDCAVLYLETEK